MASGSIGSILNFRLGWNKARARRLSGLVFAVLFALLSPAQDKPPDREARDKIKLIASIQYDVTRMNTPGAELTATEQQRTPTPFGAVVWYRLFAKGLPLDVKYNLHLLRMNGDTGSAGETMLINAAGEVMDVPDHPIVVMAQAAKGEPVVFILESQDGKHRAAAQAIPFPISAADKNCSVEAILLMPDAEAVLIRARGFKPGTAIHVAGDSAGEKHETDLVADPEGKQSTILPPYKKGVKKGEMKMTFSSSDCHPTINFAWGKGTYHVE
jgi:hypothetical protein